MLRAVPRSARPAHRLHSQSALTPRDVLNSMEGSRSAREKVESYPLVDRPADLPLHYLWSQVDRLVRTSAGLSRQRQWTPRFGQFERFPHGNAVRVGFHPKSQQTLQLVKEYLAWMQERITHLLKTWTPTPDLLDETQELKKDVTEVDLIRLTEPSDALNKFKCRRPQSIEEIWRRIDARIYSESFSAPDAIKPSCLKLSVIQRILKHYVMI